jgi:hypothetical protein
LKWTGVVSFFTSEHAMRSERVLQRLGLPARLVPGPREVSPNCGVAVAFVWDDEAEVVRALEDSKIRFEAVHHYELDDETRGGGKVTDAPAAPPVPETAPAALGGGGG